MKNRLNLDFSLKTSKERSAFLSKYIDGLNFSLNPDELETCANYVLWGKEEDGKNLVQKKEIEIETKNKTWDRRKEEESLDALFESPTFNEQIIVPYSAPTLKRKKETFDRSRALNEAPLDLVPRFLELFKEIDRLDLELSFYDLKTGKRKLPPREELLKRFTSEEIQSLKEKGEALSPYVYLKLRHLLVEKRREQFYLKDTYSEPLQSILPPLQTVPEHFIFGADIPVFPLGLHYGEGLSEKVFPHLHNIPIEIYGEEDLKEISKLFWRKKEEEENLGENQHFFSFKNLEHVYQLFLFFYEVEEEGLKKEIEGTSQDLLRTLQFYIEEADLNELQREILELKKKKVPNSQIAATINSKYNRNYTVNYISTIFTQQIIKKITEAAQFHELIISNIFFRENFKKCVRCGDMVLKDASFFMRKSRSSDGFASRCKFCEREIRGGKK